MLTRQLMIKLYEILNDVQPKVPNGMYEQVCGHFKKDVAVGIDWLSVFALWKQSNAIVIKPNTASVESGSPKKKETPPPKKQTQRPSNLRRGATATNVESAKGKQNAPKQMGQPRQLSPSKSITNVVSRHRSQESWSGSGSALTERNLS